MLYIFTFIFLIFSHSSVSPVRPRGLEEGGQGGSYEQGQLHVDSLGSCLSSSSMNKNRPSGRKRNTRQPLCLSKVPMTSETTRPKLTLKRSVGREESLGLSFSTQGSKTNPFPPHTHRPGARVGKKPPKSPLCPFEKQARLSNLLWEIAAALLQGLCGTSPLQRKKERGEGLEGTQRPPCLEDNTFQTC